MFHYKICFKKHKLCAMQYRQWKDHRIITQIRNLTTDLGVEHIILQHRKEFYRDTPFISNNSVSLPALDKFVINPFSIIMHIS
jgi:hypothetical protein